MTEYSRMAKGTYTQTTGTLGSTPPIAQFINLPFKPDYVELINLTQAITPANHGIPFAYWDATSQVTISSVTYNPTIVQIFNSTPVLTTDSVLTNGISAFSAGTLLQYGAQQQVVASTKGTTTSFQVTGHGYNVGDVVVFEGLYQSSTTGMPQMNGIPFTVTTRTDANNFVVNWNSNNSSYTNLSASPAGAYVRKILYPYLYLPGVNVIGGITTGATTTIATTTAHNYEIGQEVAFRVPTLWGTTQLNSLPNSLIPGSPMYGYVISLTDNYTFVVNINSIGYTAFTTAVSVTNVPGLTFPQVLAVGDVNTGGKAISAGSSLYPPPSFPLPNNSVGTINGPAIKGAYVNNTSQGFVVGAGACKTDTTSWVGGSANDVIEYRAYLHDLSNP